MLKIFGVREEGGLGGCSGGLQDFSFSPGSGSQSQSKSLREPDRARQSLRETEKD